jgi:hypothetical protein
MVVRNVERLILQMCQSSSSVTNFPFKILEQFTYFYFSRHKSSALVPFTNILCFY